jgi:adenosylcobinamide-GDP ribazoletransferase
VNQVTSKTMPGRSNNPGLISAIQFLTIIPMGNRAFDARAALPYFPVCGLGIGCLVLFVDWTAGRFWPPAVVAFWDVLTLIVISGALHLDGLADTGDGLYGQRSTAKILAIMKDSRIGAMGMVAAVCCLAAKWIGISSIEVHKNLWLLLVPAYSRGAVLVAIRSMPYGRPDGGTGHDFFGSPLRRADFWAFALIIGLSLAMGWDTLKINIGFALIVGSILAWYRRKLGTVTGDMLGAMIEVTEASLFLIAAAQLSI